VVAAGGAGWFWDLGSESLLWALPAHTSQIVGVHVEGGDLVTRGFTGDLARLIVARLIAIAVIIGIATGVAEFAGACGRARDRTVGSMPTSPAARCAAAWRSCRGTGDLPQADDCSPAEIRGPQDSMNWPPRLGTMS
jgi:hypothetical protein